MSVVSFIFNKTSLGIGLGVGVASYCLYYTRWMIGTKHERLGRKLVGYANRLNPNLQASATLHRGLPKQKRCEIIAATVARQCRAKFCLNEYSEESRATELTVHKWMYDKIAALPDMREADIPLIMEIAMVVVFIPSANEIAMRKARQSHWVRGTKYLFAGPWTSWFFKRAPTPRSG